MATEVDVRAGGTTMLNNGFGRKTELTRRGRGWQTMATSAVAALVVRPTTVAALEIYNGNGAGLALVIERIFTQNLVSTAVNSNGGLWAMITAPKAAPSSASLALRGKAGLTTYGKINGYGGGVVNAVGTTVVDNGWFPYGPNYTASNAAAPGGSFEADIAGALIVPSGCSLCVHVVGSIVGDTYCSGVDWYEEYIDLVIS